MKTPLISIILTLYNKASYIEETIFSIFKQSYSNWELIIVDDCSTDGSLEIAKTFCKKIGISDKCIFIKNEKNLRVAKTFEKGLTYAKGEWISMCDGDDILIKHKLERQLNVCLESGNIFCCGGCIEIDENNNFLNFWNKGLFGKFHSKYIRNRTCKETLIMPNAIGTAIFFNNEIKNKILQYGFPKKVYQDFWCEVLASFLQINIYYIDEVLFYHRVCKGCISNFENKILSYKRYFENRINVYQYLKGIPDLYTKEMKERLYKWNIINENIIYFINNFNRKNLKILFTILFTNIGIKHKFVILYQYLNIIYLKLFKK